MKTLRLTTKTVRLYESIHEISPERDARMNYFLLADMGIGCDMKAIDTHLNSLVGLVAEGKTEHLPQQVENLRMGYFSVLTSYRPDHLAWACLIESIDGIPLSDTSDEALKAVVADLGADGLTQGMLTDTLAEVKKKCPTSWYSIFPDTGMEEDAL